MKLEIKSIDFDAKLCYVHNNVAYFTTQAVEDQWGDDWDDAPYEYNAGPPYTPIGNTDWSIYKVVFIVENMWEVCYTDTDYSVQDINSGEIPWLEYENYGNDEYEKSIKIYAGCSIEQFIEIIKSINGSVYMEIV